MKTRSSCFTIILTVSVVLAYGWVRWATAAVAAERPMAVAAAAFLSVPGLVEPAHTYVGSSKCKMCHSKQYKSWKKTKKYKAIDVLLPGNATETKEKHALDPTKDYSTDEKCLKCHTTGFGHEGGYAIPDASDAKAVKKARKLANVGCESCHGPGSAYINLHMEVFKSKRTYSLEEMYAAGMRKIGASVCTTCHNAENPTFDASAAFDYEAMKDKGTHEHFPLKQRG